VAFDYDETNPAGTMFLADFPDNEQAHRLAVVSSALVDHDAEGLGEHTKLSIQPLAVDPSTSGDAGFVYTKVDGGLTELFYMDDAATVVQLTVDGSASPDKLPIAGGTMTGDLTMDGGDILVDGTGLIKLLNTLGVQGQDAAVANWRNLIQVDASDVCEIGDQSLGGGMRLNSDGEDELVAAYGSGDKKVWHAGHFANPPLATVAYESGGDTMVRDTPGSITHSIAGGTPALWTALIRCTSNDLDFETDDEVPVMHGPNQATQRGITVYATATQFKWNMAQVNDIVLIQENGTTSAIDYSKWELIFRAWY
jgi:hypothetical protein